MEIKEAISPVEERFERWRRTTGLFLGPLVFALVLLLPKGALSVEAHRLSAVLAFVTVYWLTEAMPLPVTAVTGSVLAVLLGVASPKDAFSPYANPLIFLFIGSFIIAEAITHSGLDRRFSYAIFSMKFMQRSPKAVLFAFGAMVALISMWISNTAATAMMLPIALGVLGAMREIGLPGGFDMRRFSTAMMLMVAFGASVGGLATPIGTPPNLIGIGMVRQFTGIKITFLEWMTFAVPLTVVMFLYLYFILGMGRSLRAVRLTGIEEHVAMKRAELGPWKRVEVNTGISFLTAVVLWVLPSVAALAFGKDSDLARLLDDRLNEGVAAMVAAALLFVLPVSIREGQFTMRWERAVRIDWGTILLFGGGLSLGGLMFSTGLAAKMGSFVTEATGASGLWSITALGIAFAIVLSETTSNTASANMVIPVVIAVAQGMGVSPLPAALGACLGASFGFMLPVSTPPNAIVYGSGLIPILSMARKGVLLDIGGFILIFVGLLIICPLMGWV